MAGGVVLALPYVASLVTLAGAILLGRAVWAVLVVLGGLLDPAEIRTFLEAASDDVRSTDGLRPGLPAAVRFLLSGENQSVRTCTATEPISEGRSSSLSTPNSAGASTTLESPPRERIERSREVAGAGQSPRRVRRPRDVGHRRSPAARGLRRHPRGPPAGEEWFAWDGAGRRDLRFADGLVDRVVDSAVGHGSPVTRSATFCSATAIPRERSPWPNWNTPGQRLPTPASNSPRSSSRATRSATATCSPSTAWRPYRGGRAPTSPPSGRPPSRCLARTIPTSGADGRRVRPRLRPASQYLFGFEGIYHGSPRRPSVTPSSPRPVSASTPRPNPAASTTWLHLNNLVSPRQRRRIERILRYLDANRHRVRVETMADVASRYSRTSRLPSPSNGRKLDYNNSRCRRRC